MTAYKKRGTSHTHSGNQSGSDRQEDNEFFKSGSQQKHEPFFFKLRPQRRRNVNWLSTQAARDAITQSRELMEAIVEWITDASFLLKNLDIQNLRNKNCIDECAAVQEYFQCFSQYELLSRAFSDSNKLLLVSLSDGNLRYVYGDIARSELFELDSLQIQLQILKNTSSHEFPLISSYGVSMDGIASSARISLTVADLDTYTEMATELYNQHLDHQMLFRSSLDLESGIGLIDGARTVIIYQVSPFDLTYAYLIYEGVNSAIECKVESEAIKSLALQMLNAHIKANFIVLQLSMANIIDEEQLARCCILAKLIHSPTLIALSEIYAFVLGLQDSDISTHVACRTLLSRLIDENCFNLNLDFTTIDANKIREAAIRMFKEELASMGNKRITVDFKDLTWDDLEL